jgi:hypothetical protein
MDKGQLKNVCLSVVCLSVMSLTPIIFLTAGWIRIKILLQKLRGQINFELQFLYNCHKKYYLGGISIFCPRKKFGLIQGKKTAKK